MNLNFLTGLLLIAVVLATAVFVAKELIGDRSPGDKKTRQGSAHLFEKLLGGEAKPASNHLIDSIGKVISHSDNSARPMMVRVGAELWPARLDSAEDAPLPVGTAVKVMAVDGPVLLVGAGNDPAGSAEQRS